MIKPSSTDGGLGSLSTHVNLSANVSRGDTVINLASVPAWIHVGELYILDETDDAQISETGQQSGMDILNGCGKSQIVKVVTKGANSITVELPIYENYRTSQTAKLCQSAYVAGSSIKGFGIENVSITYNTSGATGEGMTIQNCDGCWLKNVVSYNVPDTYHVWAIFDYRCEIDHSEFSYAQSDYSGGKGYGITLYYCTTASLFQDNIVHHTHVGCTVNYGASGNVFAYNYFYDGFSNQSSSRQEPSISAHGACTFENLFEGNWCSNKVLFDFTHGTAGIRNTLVRNRVLGRSVAGGDDYPISLEYMSRSNNFVGNLLGVAGTQASYSQVAPASCSGNPIYRLGYFININCDASSGYDTLSALGTIIHGNYDVVTGTNSGIVWDSTIADHSIPSSYYLAGKPSWFRNLSWPPYDPTATTAAAMSFTNIPAGYRAAFGTDPPAGSSTNYAAIPTVFSGQSVYSGMPISN
jgi:hypothetical protein